MTLMAVGQCASLESEQGIFARALAEAKGTESKICIITSGTRHYEEATRHYSALFAAIGVPDSQLSFCHTFNRLEARAEAEVEKVAKADIVIFSDGDPLRVTSLLGATPLMAAIEKRRNEGALIVGVREGAAALPMLMIYGGDTNMAMNRDGILFATGLGLVDRVIFDTHKSKEKRMMRLFNVLATNPANLGLGLGKDSAIFVRNGNDIEVIGTGNVSAVDATGCSGTNFSDISSGEEIKIDGIVRHKLVPGDRFLLREKRRPGL